jgi:LysR family transcriptional regulator, hydrogen peroxide-inducible genes activator
MNASGLSLRDLEYVVAVADHGSFVKAAEQCHVAQPSLSVQVSKLEARLNTVIFERTTRRLIVTPKGQQLVEQMRRVLVEARAIFALAGESQRPFGGLLRLSAISTLGPYVFPCILRDLRKRRPGLSVILGEDKTDALLRALLQGSLMSLSFRLMDLSPRSPNCRYFASPWFWLVQRTIPRARQTESVGKV